MSETFENLPEHATKRFKQLLGFFGGRTDDPTYVVLKSHLLAEEILREYLCAIVKRPQRLDEARLTFPQLVALSRALHPGLPDDWWGWVALNKLNSLRNQLAHRLEPQGTQERMVELVLVIFDHLVTGNKAMESAYQELIESKFHPFLVTMLALHSALLGALEIKPTWVCPPSLDVPISLAQLNQRGHE